MVLGSYLALGAWTPSVTRNSHVNKEEGSDCGCWGAVQLSQGLRS